MKIAVVGAGISGLTAAWNLAKNHEVLLFEKEKRAGGHSNTVHVPVSQGVAPLDTGFIVFNDRNYPRFVELLEALNVSKRNSEMSFSVRCDETGLEYNGSSVMSLFSQRRNLVSYRFLKMLSDIAHFNRLVFSKLNSNELRNDINLGEFVDGYGYSLMFRDKYLLPMVSAIWSIARHDAMVMPMSFFGRFFANHGLLDFVNRPNWFTVEGGSETYVNKILSDLDSVARLGAEVHDINRLTDRVRLTCTDGHTVDVDHVVLATHSDEALNVLNKPTDKEREILGAIRYVDNHVVLHQDVSLLPRQPRAWGSWNYYINSEKSEHATLTYNMQKLQGVESSAPWCVTLNNDSMNPDMVFDKYNYRHPLFDTSAVSAQQRKHEINGVNRVSFSGAYWRYGFHEDGVLSALDAVKNIDEIAKNVPHAS